MIAHLIQSCLYKGDGFEQAVRNALKRIRGSYAVGVMYEKEPSTLIGARSESPLVLGLGEREWFVASDVPAFLPYTRKVIFLEDGEMAVLNRKGVEISTLPGATVKRATATIDWSPAMAEKSGFKHFMLKEIFEQPRAIIDTFRGRIDEEKGRVFLEGCSFTPAELRDIERIVIVGCGTSWHAATVGKFMIEDLCRIPVEVDLGSEFRYRDPLINKNTLIIPISQSGETADTLAGLREGLKKKSRIISVCNVVGSSMVNCSTRAGRVSSLSGFGSVAGLSLRRLSPPSRPSAFPRIGACPAAAFGGGAGRARGGRVLPSALSFSFQAVSGAGLGAGFLLRSRSMFTRREVAGRLGWRGLSSCAPLPKESVPRGLLFSVIRV